MKHLVAEKASAAAMVTSWLRSEQAVVLVVATATMRQTLPESPAVR